MLQIRKYVNRRLYDVHTSRYITHEELYALVVRGHDIQVIAHHNGADITLSILMDLLRVKQISDSSLTAANLYALLRKGNANAR